MAGGESQRSDLERGRSSYAEERWADAFEALARADEASPLDTSDLERLVWCAALTGRDTEMLSSLERLYHAHLEGGRNAAAARAAFWLGFRLHNLGEVGRASGWLGRAQRAIGDPPRECAERGWLMLPVIHRHLGAGDHDAAHDAAAEAVAIGERCGDRDLVSFALQMQGRALMRRGEVEAGLRLVDEAMVSASAGELSPLVTGLVYCSVIASCQQVYALDRSREWTAALADWCAHQPQLVTFTGSCLVHRAEIMQLEGAWSDAEREAKRAAERFANEVDPEAVGDAHYQQAEIHRLRGELEAAEEAYRAASRYGREPHPGLALLRLAQGQGAAAMAALDRALGTTTGPLQRAQILPAVVEVALANDDLDGARRAATELDQIAAEYGMGVLGAMAAHARGAVRLAEGDARAAVEPLQHAHRAWRQVGAPYIAARIRVLLAAAYEAQGDRDGARLERDAAREVFEQLGAAPDLARLDARRGRPGGGDSHGLTPRELEVLRLVARGMTNRQIASELGVSERTIDRHVSNIFTKLELSSRSAATAFAYENGLV